jgi:RNA polymerase-binding transcription factor DksA
MNSKKQRQYLDILLDKLDDNVSSISGLRKKYHAHQRPDPGDDADLESEVSDFGLLDKLSQFEQREHKELLLAIRRAEDGTFGSCISCGEEISEARLEAKPYAIRCVPCQQREDAKAEDDSRKARKEA